MAIICPYPRTLLLSFLLVARETAGAKRRPRPGVLQDDTAQHKFEHGIDVEGIIQLFGLD
jgi:hypothetical protein